MTTKMNFEGGVNKKHTPSTATCGEAESGEASSQQVNTKTPGDKAKANVPSNRPQMNYGS